MSKLSEEVKAALDKIFPYYRIQTEFYVHYKDKKLFFDFYIPELLVVIEAQGKQHDEYVEYFHKDSLGFERHKNRDRLKKRWAEENNISLIEIREEDLPIDKNLILKKISGVV
jgi:very-short-patch-repair endonuclease